MTDDTFASLGGANLSVDQESDGEDSLVVRPSLYSNVVSFVAGASPLTKPVKAVVITATGSAAATVILILSSGNLLPLSVPNDGKSHIFERLAVIGVQAATGVPTIYGLS